MMAKKKGVPLKNIVKSHNLTPLHVSKDYDQVTICVADLNRPALQLTGFYSYFDPSRIQIIGRVEGTYLDSLSEPERRACFDTFLSYDIVALVFAHDVPAFPECMEMAEKYDRNVFITNEDTSELQANLITELRTALADTITTHGVLVEVYGEGVLITGDSGVGKSETALELIKRGHRLVADDAVEIRRVNKNQLMGSAPELIRYYMELRGIGIIDVRHLFGMGAVKPQGTIDLVIQLEPWVEGKMYDRLGVMDEYEEYLGVKVPSVLVPVRPGRNLAVILEIAAMNNRQKKLGYNAAETLATAHDAMVDHGGF